MLRKEQNDLITQTGPGTAMGQLFRSYWTPVLLADELPENDGPPVRAVARVLRRTGTGGALDLARLGVLPVRRLAQERFRGIGAELLLTGNAMHSDVPPDAAGSGIFGWLLAMLGQDVGFPVPERGAGTLAEALTRRAQSRGVQVRTGSRVTRVELVGGRAAVPSGQEQAWGGTG